MGLLASIESDVDRRVYREIILTTSTPTPSFTGFVSTGSRLNSFAAVQELLDRYSETSPTYTLTGVNSVNEGASLQITLTTQGVSDNTTLYWSVTGVSAADFSPTGLEGSMVVSGNTSTITFNIASDGLLEGEETFTFNLYRHLSKSFVLATKSIYIDDTSNGYTPVWGTTGRDAILGTPQANYLTGVVSSGITEASLGKGQIDTVKGLAGNDLFVLGFKRSGVNRVLYNNNVASSNGTGDYLAIADFTPGDKILFSSGRYFTRNSGSNTVIYWDRDNDGILDLNGSLRDEVIAIVSGVNLGNLTVTAASLPAWAIMI